MTNSRMENCATFAAAARLARKGLFLIGVSAVSMGCALTATAQAQTPAEDPAASAVATSAEADGSVIIVTAQRRAENVQAVPLSVAVITAAELGVRNLNNLQQIGLASPSLQIGHENNFTIRGVGTLAVQTTIDSAVAISLDEVNLGRSQLAENLFNDVAQVEVLSGPQGLLFGKNASAGLLNVTTTKPKLGVMEANFEAEYNLRDTTPGNGQGVISRITANVPVSENSALRISGLYSYQEPVARNFGHPGRLDQTARNWQLRAKYLADISDALNIYLIGSYAENTGTAGVFDRTWRDPGPGSLGLAPLAADGFTASHNLLSYKTNDDHFRDQKTYIAQGRIGYKLNDSWELVNIAAYAGIKNNYAVDQDFTTANGVREETNYKYHQFSNEMRLVLTDDGPLTAQFGLFYLDLTEKRSQLIVGNLYRTDAVAMGFPFCVGATPVVGPPPACGVSNLGFFGTDNRYTLTNKSRAAFGQITYELSPGIKMLAGARLTRDSLNIDLVQNQGAYFITIAGPRGAFSDSTKNTNFDYKIGMQYQPNSDLNFYATYGTGYKAPGTNPTALRPDVRLVVNAETSKNIEIGAKTSWFDKKLIMNLALFHTKYKNYQVQAFDTTIPGQTLRNAASLTNKGIELEITARPLEGLTLSGSATILDSKFDDFPGAPCYPGQTQPACDANNTFNAGGLRTPVAAKFASTFDATYKYPVSGSVTLLANGNWYHRSTVANFQVSPNPKTVVRPIDIFGASLGIELEEKYRFSIFCKNCTDKRFPTYMYNQPLDALFGINSTIQAWGFNSVRTIGASFRGTF